MPSLFDQVFRQYQNGWKQLYAQNPYSDFTRHIDDIKAEQKALADQQKAVDKGGVRTVGAGGAQPAPQPNYRNRRTTSPTAGATPFVGAPLGADEVPPVTEIEPPVQETIEPPVTVAPNRGYDIRQIPSLPGPDTGVRFIETDPAKMLQSLRLNPQNVGQPSVTPVGPQGLLRVFPAHPLMTRPQTPQQEEPIQTVVPGQRNVSNPGVVSFVGAPLGARRTDQYGNPIDDTGQPVSEPSELTSGADTSGVAESGKGRANLTAFDPKLTDIGGFTGKGGTIAGGFAPLTGALGSLSKIGQGAGGIGAGGGGGGGGGYTTGSGGEIYDPQGNVYMSPGTGYYTSGGALYDPQGNVYMSGGGFSGGDGGGGAGGTGGGGMGGGMSGAGKGSAIAGALSAFADQVSKSMAPVTVDPTKWAGPIPNPVYFSAPTLARNTGGTAPWA
jgi:hypothetical protein